MFKTISVVISTRVISSSDYVEHVRKTSGNPNVEVLMYANDGQYSLAELYNKGLEESKNDIVVFCHDDLIFDTNNWCSKLLKHFNSSEYGIIGVAGTDYLQTGCWWQHRARMYGVVNHIHNGKRHTNHYSKGFGDDIKPVVVVDGLFMAVCKPRLKATFNELFQGFHFYDIPFCLENHVAGVKIGVVTNIRLTHLSIGAIGEKWTDSYKLFNQIYSDKLPCMIA